MLPPLTNLVQLKRTSISLLVRRAIGLRPLTVLARRVVDKGVVSPFARKHHNYANAHLRGGSMNA